MMHRWLNRILITNIIVQAGIIVTGAIVRVSGSGLGCPSWPRCTQGSYIPTVHQAESWHKWVEYGNRTLTGILLIVAISVFAGVWTHTRDKKSRRLALTPLALTFGQAILGGITVITGLNPLSVASHFILSAIIVIFSVRLWWRIRSNNAPQPMATQARWYLASAALVVILGVVTTGSGPHSGDAKAEARFGIDPTAISALHGLSVALFVVALLSLMKHIRTNKFAVTWFRVIGSVVAIQAIVGITQFSLGLPAVLVAIHVALAAILWTGSNVLAIATNE